VKAAEGIRFLQAHRHHDIPGAADAGRANQAARVAVGHADLDFSPIHGRQRIEEVAHVEADFQFVTLVVTSTCSSALPAPGLCAWSVIEFFLSASRIPRYFSFARIEVALEGGTEHLSIGHDALGEAAGITRLYSGNLPSISFDVKRTSPIWART
jgi:hypothetical protein